MREIQIGGLVPFTTIDYPGKLTAVLFLRGCPLRCAYCSNRHLLDVGDGEYDPAKVMDWLRSRVGKLEAVVFSGGEALMQGDAVIEYMRCVRDLGFSIGLHTNGFYPDTLARAAQFVDWIGLDYKATRDKYEQLVGNSIAYDNMQKSLDLWLKTGRDIEVRITCDPRYVRADELCEIADDLVHHGVRKIAVQKYIPHFPDEESQTTPADRNIIFGNNELRTKINSMFDSVIWRE